MAIWRKNRDGAFSPEPADEPTGAPVTHEDAPPVVQEASEVVTSTPAQADAPIGAAEARPEHDPSEESRENQEAPSEVVAPEPADEQAPAPTYRPLPRILAVANQKGGVGKTTTTINLGAGLAEMGYRVLVVDLDPQGNATTGLGIQRKNFEHSMYDVIMREHPLEDVIEATSVKNLFVAPATLDLSGVEIELVPAFSREMRLKRALEPLMEDFDFVLIDCPPSLGLITINALSAAGEVLVPIQCEYYALEGLSQLRNTLKLVAGNLNPTLEMSTIVLTMFDSRTRLASDVRDDVRAHFPDQVCDTIIPRTVRLSEAPSFGQPITTFDTNSRGAHAYRALAVEVSGGAPKRAG
jgi:chromosome partitioning protein